jgi:cobalt-zinc-cadmium efflux system protein
VSGAHAHAAAHRHGRDYRPEDRRALGIALGITAAFLAFEVVGGLLAGSLALLADAGHMATDVAALGVALYAIRLAGRRPTHDKTFGHRRAEILAALANGVVLAVVSVYVVREAIGRIGDPHPVKGGLMLGVAIVGLAANLVAAWALASRRRHSLNLRGAFLHVVGDALGSIGAIVAAVVITTTGWTLADPLVAIGIAALILVSAWNLVRESLDVLMEATPGHVDLEKLIEAIREVPGVVDVHDLHVWTLTSGYHALSAHVDVSSDADGHAVLHILSDLAGRRFEIAHTTFQLERMEPLLQIDA